MVIISTIVFLCELTNPPGKRIERQVEYIRRIDGDYIYGSYNYDKEWRWIKYKH